MRDRATKWRISAVNQGIKMTRVNYSKGWIEDRDLTLWEKILLGIGWLDDPRDIGVKVNDKFRRGK